MRWKCIRVENLALTMYLSMYVSHTRTRACSLKYTEEHFAPDCSMEWAVESDMPNTDLNKTYHGHAGMIEFTRRLPLEVAIP